MGRRVPAEGRAVIDESMILDVPSTRLLGHAVGPLVEDPRERLVVLRRADAVDVGPTLPPTEPTTHRPARHG